MRSERAAVRPVVGQDDPSPDSVRIPATIASKQRGQTTLAIDRTHQLVHVDEFGLEFDDEQDPPTGMPGEDVYDAALSVDRERHFWFGDPSIQRLEPSGHRFMHGGVTDTDQPAKISSLPADDGIEAGVERRRDPTDLPQRDGRRGAALDPPDDASRYACSGGHVILTQALPNTDRPECDAGLMIIHPPSVVRRTHPRRIGASDKLDERLYALGPPGERSTRGHDNLRARTRVRRARGGATFDQPALGSAIVTTEIKPNALPAHARHE